MIKLTFEDWLDITEGMCAEYMYSTLNRYSIAKTRKLNETYLQAEDVEDAFRANDQYIKTLELRIKDLKTIIG